MAEGGGCGGEIVGPGYGNSNGGGGGGGHASKYVDLVLCVLVCFRLMCIYFLSYPAVITCS